MKLWCLEGNVTLPVHEMFDNPTAGRRELSEDDREREMQRHLYRGQEVKLAGLSMEEM